MTTVTCDKSDKIRADWICDYNLHWNLVLYLASSPTLRSYAATAACAQLRTLWKQLPEQVSAAHSQSEVPLECVDILICVRLIFEV